MDDRQTDYEVLAAACRSLGVDPDGPHAPDLHAIAERDEPLEAKRDRVRDAICEATNGDRPGR